MTRERLLVVAHLLTAMKAAFREGKDWRAYEAFVEIEDGGDLEEILYIWKQLEPRETNIIKSYQKAARNGQR